jgi:DNA polymerase-3 subunit epsilon
MISQAQPVASVMRDAARFVGKTPLVAHDASFDRKFLEAVLHSPNHRLSTLVELLGLPKTGRAHRAMVDAEMTSHLWCRIQHDVSATYCIQSVGHELLTRVQTMQRKNLPALMMASRERMPN